MENDATKRAIKEVGLTEYKHFSVKTLSGGMKRRLSLAIALVG
jgi:ABC-type multidrug transport system ATPase subunit